jgi:hypothetical protein
MFWGGVLKFSIFFLLAKYLTFSFFDLQKLSCLARLRVVHRGDQCISQIWSTHAHRHDADLDNSFVFKTQVSYVMSDLCSKGLSTSKIGVVLCD